MNNTVSGGLKFAMFQYDSDASQKIMERRGKVAEPPASHSKVQRPAMFIEFPHFLRANSGTTLRN